jgi:hypothetical protein
MFSSRISTYPQPVAAVFCCWQPDQGNRHKMVPSNTAAREARHKLGLSQAKFAALIGTGVVTGGLRKVRIAVSGRGKPRRACRVLLFMTPICLSFCWRSTPRT